MTALSIDVIFDAAVRIQLREDRFISLNLSRNAIAVKFPTTRRLADFLGVPHYYVLPFFAMMEQDELVCKEVRIALGVAAPTPMRAFKAETLLRGRKISDELLDLVSVTAADEAQPRDSIRGEAWYRRDMIKVFVKRMVVKCIERIVQLKPQGSFC